MNRCTVLSASAFTAIGRRSLLLGTLLLATLSGAHAQQVVRPFPANTQRGTMQVTYPPELLMNGQRTRLSPGARIRSSGNLLVLSGTLAGQTLLVNYVRDPQGLVHEVWILNEAEAQQAMPGAIAPPNYVSDGTTASGETGGKVSTPTSTTQP